MNYEKSNNNSSSYDLLHESANIFEDELDNSLAGLEAWKSASRAAKHMSKHSKVVNPKMEKQIPRILCEEIVIGKLLGTGGFNSVYALDAIQLVTEPLKSELARKICSETQQLHRAFLAKHAHRESSGEKRYAIKFLSQNTIDDPEKFCTGAADLVVEAKFLASLEHPNIIKLRGMSAAGTKGFASCSTMGYFLLLDGLSCTLEDRLVEWKKQAAEMSWSNKPRNFLSGFGKKRSLFLADRMHISFDVASALQFLHANNIICKSLSHHNLILFALYVPQLRNTFGCFLSDRDLKPDNIGFDFRGDVKLFDFGLAKELDDTMKSGHCSDFYELSGNTGSLRYMAPEVALSQPYNLTADVYSFGLLLWQVCSLEVPYDGMSRHVHSIHVVNGNERPTLYPEWSLSLRILMKRSWERNPFLRPSMDAIYKILKREITALRDGDETGLENFRRNPTFALNKASVVNPSQRVLPMQVSQKDEVSHGSRQTLSKKVFETPPSSHRQATAA